jgi:hypothetical protein
VQELKVEEQKIYQSLELECKETFRLKEEIHYRVCEIEDLSRELEIATTANRTYADQLNSLKAEYIEAVNNYEELKGSYEQLKYDRMQHQSHRNLVGGDINSDERCYGNTRGRRHSIERDEDDCSMRNISTDDSVIFDLSPFSLVQDDDKNKFSSKDSIRKYVSYIHIVNLS